MGELISAANLTPQALVPTAIPAGTPLPTTGGGFQINMSDIKEIISLVSDGVKNIKDLMALKAQLAPQQQPQQQQQNIGRMNDAPQIPQGSGTPQTKEVITMVQTKMIVDRTKLKILLNDLLVNQASKLPDDIKQKKLEEFFGEKWTNFTYKYKGVVNVDSATLLDTVTEQLATAIDEMLVNKEVKK